MMQSSSRTSCSSRQHSNILVGVGMPVGVTVGVRVEVGTLVGVGVGVLVDVGVGIDVPVGVGVGVGVLVGVGVGIGNQLLKMTGRYIRRGVGVSASTSPAPLKSRRTNIAQHPFFNRLIAASSVGSYVARHSSSLITLSMIFYHIPTWQTNQFVPQLATI